MNQVIHTIPFFIRNLDDLKLAEICLGSLAESHPQGIVVLYNQGILTNKELEGFLKDYDLRFFVIGEGANIGIGQGRMACFRHIWENFSDTKFISEIHIDMFFSQNWVKELIHFLETNSQEPMVCPGILTSQGELHPDKKGKITVTEVPFDNEELMKALLNQLTLDKVVEGFVHPVIHRSEALKAVGGYDTRFLPGKQGYEDDSLLIGYRYYLGTKSNWKPKCLLKTRVFHATLAQRMSLADKNDDFRKNLRGLIYQYGVKGLLELNSIYEDNNHLKK